MMVVAAVRTNGALVAGTTDAGSGTTWWLASDAGAAAAALDAVLVPLGSAGYKTLAVVRGEADAYVHAGGMYQWDSAAPVAVARAAGLFTSRLDGSPLEYAVAEAWLPDLVVCRPELADRVLAAVRAGA